MQQTTATKKQDTVEKISLNVPFIRQADNFDCSIAALQMIMRYWGDAVDYIVLKRELSPWINEKEKTHLQGVGIYLARRGYEVYLNYHDANVIDKAIDGITELEKDQLVEALKRIPDETSTQFQRKKISLDIDFIESGGKYSTVIPTLALIDSRLANKVPTMICVKLQIWKSNPSIKNNHYVVIVGKENDHYIINDPGSNITGPYRVQKDKLLMAWYACGAYTLSASPRKTPLG